MSMRALAFMLASYDFADALGSPRGAMGIAASEGADCRFHSLAYARLLGFVAIARIAPLTHPVRGDLLQQLCQGGAFPPGFAFQFSLLLGGNAPTVDVIFHALQCSAK